MALTKKDLKDTEKRLEKKLDDKLQGAIDQLGGRMEEIREEIKVEMNEKISRLPTKSEFYTAMDAIMTELKAVREEQVAMGSRFDRAEDKLEDHETRISNLEV